MNRLDIEKDIFLGDDFVLSVPKFVELDDNNEFSLNKESEEDVITDEEFMNLLEKLGIKDEDNTSSNLSLDEERKQFEMEKKLAYEKIKLEYELLNFAKEKFERDKKSWETLKKISETNLKTEKEDFEVYKQIEKKRMYLETEKLVDGCKNFKELFEYYNRE